MSVVGFDLGTDYSKIAVAYKKKIQVVPNEITKLITPSLTAFSPKERSFGDVAKTQWGRNYKNTISQMKRWLGRNANDPKLQQEASFWLPGITTGTLADGRFGINVDTSQGQLCLAPEQILCGLLGQLKKFTSTFLNGLKITDCVIACPTFYDDAQRRALLNAAKLAELKVLRLLEESTAIALNYGILRNLPENETQRVIFVDIGYASTQVAIVDFVRGKLSVRYKASNPFVGGRDFDNALYQVFRKTWQQKHNTDVDTLPKQKLKLLRACTAIKKLLTGNRDAHWVLDCFHDDHDFPLEIHRHEMEESATKLGLYAAMLQPLIEALDATKADKIKIHSCEIVGGPSRIISIQTAMLALVQKYEPDIKNLSTTLNGDECVARGCALMCAMLSPNFRVREFQVQDVITWPITICYPTEKENADKKIIQQLIITRGNPQPCTAKVMFNKTKNFVFKLQHPCEYKESKEEKDDTNVSVRYPFRTNLNIGEFNVQLLPLSEKAVQAPKIKLLLDINKHGVLNWPQASLIEYVKKDPPPPPLPPKKEAKADKKKADKTEKKKTDKDKEQNATEATEANSKTDEDNDSAMKDKTEANGVGDGADKKKENADGDKAETKEADKMEMDGNGDEAESTETKPVNKKKKEKKKITRDLLITGNFFNELKADEFNAMFSLEGNFINVDRIVHETDEAKNDLETYVYSLRDKIDESHRDYIAERDRLRLSQQLTDMEDWVYDKGDDANKTAFLERLKTLRDIGDPMEYRLWEYEHRDGRVNNFKKLVFKYQQWPDNKDEKYAHIGESERKVVRKYADDADAWITNNIIKQDKLKKYEMPLLKCKDVDNKYRALYEKCNKIVTTPKPPPPKPKEEEKEKKEEDESKEKGKGDGKAPDTPKPKEKDVKAKGDGNLKEKGDGDNDTEMTDATKVENDEIANGNLKNGDKNSSVDGTDGMEVE